MKTLGAWDTIACETEEGVATLTLNRPDDLNLMDMRMRVELREALLQVESDPDVRALVVTGAGGAFSAGGDMNDFVDRSAEEMYAVIQEKSHKWFEVLWRLSKPTIAAVNGVAAGGAVNLVLACDFVIASERAKFGETFVKVGLVPDLGGLFLLPRTVGLHRAKALCLTGEVIDAIHAQEIGIVYRVVPHDQLGAETQALATQLASGPTQAYAAMKSALNRSFESSMDDVLQFELYAQSFLFGTQEHNARLGGFLGLEGNGVP